IFNTHEHGDHTGGNAALVRQTGASVLAHAEAAGRIGGVTHGLNGGELVRVGRGVQLRCLDTPGHTRAHMCLYAQGLGAQPPALFSGDTLFNAGVGNCIHGGDPQLLYESFADYLSRLPAATRVFPGHEYLLRNLGFTLDSEPSNQAARELAQRVTGLAAADMPILTLGEEKQVNVFFRLDRPEIIAGLQHTRPAMRSEPTPRAVFLALRVLAGAGSGKTRVLTHRIAWLITTEGVSPHGVLAVTFTNKAAAEMRGRVEQLLGMPGSALWLGTFHGIAHRLLRMHWREAGLVQSFQILDAEDQLRLIKRLLKSQQLDENRWIPREVQYFINKHKDEGRRPTHLKTGIDATEAQMIKLYAQYEENCARSGVIDFAELLLRAYELWRDTPALLRHYRSRFRHVLVDEFQDTNAIQYAWIRLLVGSEGAPFVVGDDDQSIYRRRGARVENLHKFRDDFPQAKLCRLEQNYRSTASILEAANALIANNSARLGKTLWTSGARGAPVRLFAAYNERDEADFVVTRILDWTQRGGLRREIAILYRSNAQSRTFEEAL